MGFFDYNILGGSNLSTEPMADEIAKVSHGVQGVTNAVITMQAAVIAAEQQGAELVCQNVNRGFYALMHSQISQKIAMLTSTVEAKLFESVQYATALKTIQSRMTKDYNMISGRYSKLFGALNNNLEVRVAELDMPVFKLVDRDLKILDSRICINSAAVSVGQLESVLSSQMIAASKVKRDAESAIGVIADYARESRIQSMRAEASMQNISVDTMEDIFIPVSVMEATTQSGTPSVSYHVATSGDPGIDRKIDLAVREYSVNSVIEGNWTDIDPDHMDKVAIEFRSMLSQSSLDERLKDQMQSLFNLLENVQQLNPDNYELLSQN